MHDYRIMRPESHAVCSHARGFQTLGSHARAEAASACGFGMEQIPPIVYTRCVGNTTG